MELLLLTSFLISFQSVLTQVAGEKKALIFDRFTRSLFYLPKKVSQDAECGAWAIACPAETLAEENFIEQYSFTKNALFVRLIHEKDSKASEVKNNICKHPYKISLTYNIKSRTYQMGFEIYYELKDQYYFHNSNFKDYKSPEEAAVSKTTLWKKGKFFAKEYFRVLRNAIDSGIKELWLNRNRRLGFTWIYLAKFRFDFSKKMLKKISYDIGSNSRWPVLGEKCDDYSLGTEFYTFADVDNDIYENKDRSILESIKMPEKICTTNFDCFVKLSIVPIDQFRFGKSSAPLCSNMTTVPVWRHRNIIEYFLKKIDQYLYALYRVVNEPLHITTELNGEHEFPKNKRWGKSKIYLDPKNERFPVPKTISKTVEYRMKDCISDEKYCWFSVVIVIHNDPFFNSKDRICKEEVTDEWGWEEITKDEDGNFHDFVYICPREIYARKKLLGITVYKTPINSSDLKLNQFHVGPNTVESIREKVDTMFTHFKNHGDDFDDEEEGKPIEVVQRDDISPEDQEYATEEQISAQTADEVEQASAKSDHAEE